MSPESGDDVHLCFLLKLMYDIPNASRFTLMHTISLNVLETAYPCTSQHTYAASASITTAASGCRLPARSLSTECHLLWEIRSYTEQSSEALVMVGIFG